jgi:hypothetical protein
MSASCTIASACRWARLRGSPIGRSVCRIDSSAARSFAAPIGSRWNRPSTDPSACRARDRNRLAVGSGSGPSASSRSRKVCTSVRRSAWGRVAANAAITAAIAARSTPWAAASATGRAAAIFPISDTASAPMSPRACAAATAGSCSSARPLRTTCDAVAVDSRQCPPQPRRRGCLPVGGERLLAVGDPHRLGERGVDPVPLGDQVTREIEQRRTAQRVEFVARTHVRRIPTLQSRCDLNPQVSGISTDR